jgi:hypothetical protein
MTKLGVHGYDVRLPLFSIGLMSDPAGQDLEIYLDLSSVNTAEGDESLTYKELTMHLQTRHSRSTPTTPKSTPTTTLVHQNTLLTATRHEQPKQYFEQLTSCLRVIQVSVEQL